MVETTESGCSNIDWISQSTRVHRKCKSRTSTRKTWIWNPRSSKTQQEEVAPHHTADPGHKKWQLQGLLHTLRMRGLAQIWFISRAVLLSDPHVSDTRQLALEKRAGPMWSSMWSVQFGVLSFGLDASASRQSEPLITESSRCEIWGLITYCGGTTPDDQLTGLWRQARTFISKFQTCLLWRKQIWRWEDETKYCYDWNTFFLNLWVLDWYIGPILDDTLNEKILIHWNGALSSHSVCLSVCVCLAVYRPHHLAVEPNFWV